MCFSGQRGLSLIFEPVPDAPLGTSSYRGSSDTFVSQQVPDFASETGDSIMFRGIPSTPLIPTGVLRVYETSRTQQ